MFFLQGLVRYRKRVYLSSRVTRTGAFGVLLSDCCIVTIGLPHRLQLKPVSCAVSSVCSLRQLTFLHIYQSKFFIVYPFL